MSYHQHAQQYRPPAVFNTARPRWWLRALAFLALTLIVALAAFGVARLLVDFTVIDENYRLAHDQGVDDGLRSCGVKR